MKTQFTIREADIEEVAKKIRAWGNRRSPRPVRVFMSVFGVAKHFQVHTNTVYAWLENGTIFPHAEKQKDGWKIPVSDLDALKENGRIKQRTPEEMRHPQMLDANDAPQSMLLNPVLAASCIYFLLSKSGEVLYVGQSTNPLMRLGTHIHRIPRIDRVHLRPCQDEELDEMEQRYILKYLPPYNRVTIFGEPLDGKPQRYITD